MKHCLRGTKLVKLLAVLHHAVTFSRLLWAGGFSAVAAVAAHDGRVALPWAGVLIALALLEEASDLFDGVLARRAGKAGGFGSILDPMADSLGRMAIYFSLALTGCVGVAVPLVMVGRDIVVAYCRTWAAMKGASTSARLSGKVKAVVQGAGIFVLVVLAWASNFVPPGQVSAWRIVIAAMLIIVTGWSLLGYVLNAVRLPACRSETPESPRT